MKKVIPIKIRARADWRVLILKSLKIDVYLSEVYMPYSKVIVTCGILLLSLVSTAAAPQLFPLEKSASQATPNQQPNFIPAWVKSVTQHSAYQSPGKPSVAVSLLGNPIFDAPLDQPKSVELVLDTSLKSGDITVSLAPSANLSILNSDLSWNFSLSSEQPLGIPLIISAKTEGQHFVNIFVTHRDENGQTNTRALAAEFRVNMPTIHKSYAKSIRMGDGNSVHKLKSVETIY
jgi:hypothetical protein